MFCKRLVLLLALGAMTDASALAADAPTAAVAACPPGKSLHHARPRVSMRRVSPKEAPAPIAHAAPVVHEEHGPVLHEGQGWGHVERVEASGMAGVSWGLTSGIGQLGATGATYIAVDRCWTREPVYDAFDNYLGERPVNICFELHP